MYLDTGLDGLGKFSLKKSLKKVTKAVKKVALLPVTATKYGIIKPLQRSKTLRKAALIGATGAALWFGGPLVASGAGKLFGGGKKPATLPQGGADSASYLPESESGDTTGYEGQDAAMIPAQKPFTPDLFTNVERGVKVVSALRQKPPTQKVLPQSGPDSYMQEPQSIDASIMPSMNTSLIIGAGVGLLALVLMMRKKK